MLTAALTLLLIVANGVPVLVGLLLAERLARPVDGRRVMGDGHPVFGANKTWRGLLASLGVTSLLAWLLGLGALVGLVTAAGAMGGDLLSSFFKRRLGLHSGARASGFDQLPESAIPALLLYIYFDLNPWALTGAVIIFVLAHLLLSPLLFRWGLRRAPH